LTRESCQDKQLYVDISRVCLRLGAGASNLLVILFIFQCRTVIDISRKKCNEFFGICMVGRLELYMKQNHENVERAESELNTLHEDMEQTLELQRRLAQR
jgi:uncharacterized membrane protein YgaE (UPF0421/DUF939 family)